MRARPVTMSVCAARSLSRASVTSRAPISSPRITSGAHSSERQPRRWRARRPRWSRPRSPLRTATASRCGRAGLGRAPTRRGRDCCRVRLWSSSPLSIDTAILRRVPSRSKMSQCGAPVSSQIRRATRSGTSPASLDEQRRELETGAQDGAQVLALAPKPREIAWMCGSISSRRAGAPGRPQPDSGGGRLGCDGRRCARRRSSAARCSR